MKIRIISGESDLRKNFESDQLKELYRSAKLIIQGSDEVMKIGLDDGRQAFLAGNLVGMRTPNNEIVPCSTYHSESLKVLIQTSSIEKCQEVLEGRYVLAVAGPENTCSICADRYGQFDLYYQTADDPSIFASELFLLPFSPSQDRFDQVALAYALTVYGCRPPKRQTFYQDVRRLGVREMVHIDDDQVKLSEVPFQGVVVGKYGERELVEHAELMIDAVRVRGSKYGNVVYLSSGWDSTAILACLVHLFGEGRVRAVTGRMRYSERSGVINPFEIKKAKAVADYFGIPLDVVEFDHRQEDPNWEKLIKPLLKSHHVTGHHSLNHNILADFVARTSNGDEAVFAGEISDGAYNFGFTQQNTIFHPDFGFRQYGDKMASYLFGPTFLGLMKNMDFVKDPVYDLLRRQTGDAIFDEAAAEGPDSCIQQLLSSMFLRRKRLPFWSLRNCKMLSKRGIQIYSEEMESNYLRRAARTASADTLYSWYLELYNSFHWQSSNVVTLSLTAEANGITMALPFWDSRIQNLLSAMPEEMGRGLDLNPTKYPLKWMLKNRIDYPLDVQVGPHSYLYDISPSFNLGAEMLYGSAYVPYYKSLLRSRTYREILSEEIFNLDYIDVVVKSYLEGVEMSGSELFDLSSLVRVSMVL